MEWVEEAKQLAEQAAIEAGTYARERFGSRLTVDHKSDSGDLVTEVDVHTDAMIVRRIRSRFPDHAIESEEAGHTTGAAPSDVIWHVDPLDGTNNYALGIPLYGVCISAYVYEETVLGVIYDSQLGIVYGATGGGGATQDGVPIHAKPVAELRKGTISWIQGHAVGKQDEQALRLRHALEAQLKRVLRVWAPSLTWAMLARGDLAGLVLYNSEGCDLYAGLLLAREAGVRVTDFRGTPVTGACPAEPYLVAAHPDNHAELLRIVQQALGV